MTQEDEIADLQKELQQNPKSALFAQLAELYLAREMTDEAEALVKQGLKFHPRSISGLILLGRIFKLKKQANEALTALTEATKLASDNWKAWLELAETHLELKNGKLALFAFKKVLFLNPKHPRARRAVAKLELLTADEYEAELFQMKKLPESFKDSKNITTLVSDTWAPPDEALIRTLSYIDALIVRNENEKAMSLLNECSINYAVHPEIESRKLKLSIYESADLLLPRSVANASLSRKKIVKEKQIAALKMLLRRIEVIKSDLLRA